MEANNNKRLIDISEKDLELIMERTVKRVLDARLPKPPPKYYTVAQAAKILDTSRVTLYRLKNEGKINYRRLNGTCTIRFTQDDLDTFLLKNPAFSDRHGTPVKD